jgi:hypothetical protein
MPQTIRVKCVVSLRYAISVTVTDLGRQTHCHGIQLRGAPQHAVDAAPHWNPDPADNITDIMCVWYMHRYRCWPAVTAAWESTARGGCCASPAPRPCAVEQQMN